MNKKAKKYDSELLTRIAEEANWPEIDNSELSKKLVQIAHKEFAKKTVGGYLSSILIYQQVIEEFLINLLELSNLYVQGEIWPARIEIKTKNRLMFGQLVKEHQRTIDFDDKDDLLQQCDAFNKIRIKFVHNLLKFKNNKEVIESVKDVPNQFLNIIDLYFSGRSHILWLLDDLNKRVDWKDLLSE